jgi:hypothetical protein
MPKVVSDAIGKVTSIKEQKQKKCLSIRRHHGGAAAFSLAFGPHGHNVTCTFQTFPQRNSKGFCSGRAVEYGGTRRGRNHQHFHRQTIEWDASLPTARPRTNDEFQILWNSSDNNWNTLPNVKVWFNEAGQDQGVNGSNIPGINGKDYSAGSLTVGYEYGALGPTHNNHNFFGPELGFGFNVPYVPLETNNEKMLIFKRAWGGKSLARDYRPPSSTIGDDSYCQPPDCDSTQVGHFYQVMMKDVRNIMEPRVLANIFPDLSGLAPTSWLWLVPRMERRLFPQ